MNKLLIVFLAIALVSVHAFVKRDAPAPAENNALADLQKSFEDLLKKANESLKETFDPEKMKREFGQFVDNASKVLNGNKQP